VRPKCCHKATLWPFTFSRGAQVPPPSLPKPVGAHVRLPTNTFLRRHPRWRHLSDIRTGSWLLRRRSCGRLACWWRNRLHRTCIHAACVCGGYDRDRPATGRRIRWECITDSPRWRICDAIQCLQYMRCIYQHRKDNRRHAGCHCITNCKSIFVWPLSFDLMTLKCIVSCPRGINQDPFIRFHNICSQLW